MPRLDTLRRRLIGTPLSTSAHHGEPYSNAEALAILSSDALSWVAYATQEIVQVLGMGGVAALPGETVTLLVAMVLMLALMFSGISALAGLLLVIVDGSVSRLIPLYTLGVFISIIVSQAGMVVNLWKRRDRGWRSRALINGIGAAITAVVGLVLLVIPLPLPAAPPAGGGHPHGGPGGPAEPRQP